jgi:dTDP-4-dehydrorhamnose reductase
VKILVLGGTGMLGNAVAGYFQKKSHYDVTASCRTSGLLNGVKTVQFDALKDTLDILPGNCEYVINCIGIIKPFMALSAKNAIEINALFPWRLSEWCGRNGSKLIHITTDCVFSGRKGKYVESDLHDALDEYGKSKSLGECKSAMLLRTSIIGEEIHKDASLVSWAKSRKGKTAGGYATHLWNGVTTNEYARVCDMIITQGLYEDGVFHIFAKDDVSKLQMLEYFNDKFNLGINITEERPEAIDRTLRTGKPLCAKLGIPTVREMVMAMK